MYNIKRKVSNEFKDNKEYIFISILISILTILPEIVFSSSLIHTVFLLFLLFLLFLISKFSKTIFSVFIIYLNFVNMVIMHVSIHWGNMHKFEPILELAYLSPKYETIEYLSDYLGYADILIVMYSLSVYYILYKYITHYRHSYKVLRLISISVMVIVISIVSIFKNLFAIMPLSVFYDYLVVKDRVEKYIDRNRIIQSKSNKINNKKIIYDKVIVIMGESSNKHHMEIYGYNKGTTPFFSKLKDNDQLFVFNSIAPAAQTRFSVPLILTSVKGNGFYSDFLQSKSVVTDFKNHGYRTYWISNQGKVGLNDSAITSIANEADIKIFANVESSAAEPDEIVLDYLNEIQTKDNNLQMFVLHLMGSHGTYKERYSEKVKLYNTPQNVVEEYDNSIRYTDYIIENIFNNFKNQKTLIIYTSDHGEVISYGERGHGHGHFIPYKDSFEIPLIFYSSIENERINEIYGKNQKNYFNNENLYHMINYVSYLSDENEVSYSSKVFTQDPSNVYHYDKLDYISD